MCPRTWLGKWDLVSQVSKAHKLGVGVTYRQHKLDVQGTSFRSRSIGFDLTELTEIYEIVYPESGTPGFEDYVREPFELSAYIQDKMEFEEAEKGTITKKEIMEDFIKHNTKFVKTDKPFKIIVDAGNGMGSYTFPKIFKKLPFKFIPYSGYRCRYSLTSPPSSTTA